MHRWLHLCPYDLFGTMRAMGAPAPGRVGGEDDPVSLRDALGEWSRFHFPECLKPGAPRGSQECSVLEGMEGEASCLPSRPPPLGSQLSIASQASDLRPLLRPLFTDGEIQPWTCKSLSGLHLTCRWQN